MASIYALYNPRGGPHQAGRFLEQYVMIYTIGYF